MCQGVNIRGWRTFSEEKERRGGGRVICVEGTGTGDRVWDVNKYINKSFYPCVGLGAELSHLGPVLQKLLEVTSFGRHSLEVTPFSELCLLAKSASP